VKKKKKRRRGREKKVVVLMLLMLGGGGAVKSCVGSVHIFEITPNTPRMSLRARLIDSVFADQNKKSIYDSA